MFLKRAADEISRMRKLNRTFSPLLVFVIFSLCLHFLAGTGVVLYEKYWAFQAPLSEPITINIIENSTVLNRPEKVVQVKEKIENAKQVVEQNVENEEEFNKTATLLSARNYKTKKQTIAQNHGQFQNIKTSQTRGKERATEKLAKPRLAVTPSSSLKNLRLQTLLPSLGVGDFRIKDAQKMIQKSRPEDPSNERTGNAAQGQGSEVSQSQDYLKNVDKGLETLLNTREFKYYSYYNRIRRQLSEHWEGIVRERVMRIYKEGRTIASSQDRITKLLVVLNSAGLLVNVQVLSDSGVQDLDEAAVDAFRSAAPFPNPPKGIVEIDGTVRIRWDMVLET